MPDQAPTTTRQLFPIPTQAAIWTGSVRYFDQTLPNSRNVSSQ